jgi:hypothetical protein
MSKTKFETDLDRINQAYHLAILALAYDNLSDSLKEALVGLGGEEAPEYEGMTYVTGLLDVAVLTIAENI